MRAGNLRHRVILQSPGGVIDEFGERETTWTDVATVWASIDPLSVREQFLAQQAQSITTHKVKFRYDSSLSVINASWRVKFGTRVFVIDGVINKDERNKEYELLCTEGLREE
jgi:SPP1 family predicted phage head-tail adaptor